MPIDLLHFVRKWNASTLTERSAAQQHFRDLCEALNVPHPTEADEVGATYTYEKRVTKAGTGEQGFADVWKRGFFAWEYKSKGGDLRKAYKQLNEYHESLDNPHLLVVCDFVRFEVHTKFENTPTRVFAFTLDDLLESKDTPTCALPPVEVLRACFVDTTPLRPGNTAVRVTRAAATDLLRLATRLELESRPTPLSREQIARFLMRIVFCLFADSIGLLPHHTFRALILSDDRFLPTRFRRKLRLLFQAMSEVDGIFGPHTIRYFNGGLFTDDHVIELDKADLAILHSAASHDWSHIEPTIFGTLFERSLDAAKRSLIGAHYTSTEDILLLIEPVVIDPLRRRWHTVRAEAEAALAAEAPSVASSLGAPPSPTNLGSAPHEPLSESGTNLGAPPSPTASLSAKVGYLQSLRLTDAPEPASAEGAPTYQPGPKAQVTASPKTRGLKARNIPPTIPAPPQPTLKLDRPALRILTAWTEELTRVRILDPACGSGNFLYVALRRLLDLWFEAQTFATHHNLALLLDPIPSPQQLFGIETDFYAHEIASVVVWIGFLQWKHEHAIREDKEPLLQALTNIQHNDAILRYNAEGKPYEPTWPPAEFIVGNPPFLGGQDMLRDLGHRYVDDLRSLYSGRLPGGVDLVVYWFEKARHNIEYGLAGRAGLLATQSIRGGSNRAVLSRVKTSGNIFWAVSDRPWRRNDATTKGREALVAVSMVAFDNGSETAVELNGAPVDEIHPNLTAGVNTTQAYRLTENQAIAFQGPVKVGKFELSNRTGVEMLRLPNPHGRSNAEVIKPWLNAQDMKYRPHHRFIIDFGGMDEHAAALFEAPFEYVRAVVKPLRDSNPDPVRRRDWWKLGRSGDGLSNAKGKLSRLLITGRIGKHRVFEWVEARTVPDCEIVAFARDDDYFFGLLQSQVHEIWARAQGTQVRDALSAFRYTPKSTFDTFPFPWPPSTEPTEAEDPRVRAIAEAARTLVRLRDAWLNPPDTPEADLKKRTLTNLYNQRPTWLANAHRTLDEAVFAAYGWPPNLTTQQILANLLALNHQRAAAHPPAPPKPKRPRPTTPVP